MCKDFPIYLLYLNVAICCRNVSIYSAILTHEYIQSLTKCSEEFYLQHDCYLCHLSQLGNNCNCLRVRTAAFLFSLF